MKVKFYGTRGSIPVCEEGFQKFGGNTTCVLITLSNGRIAILDAGSGIRNLGKDMIANDIQQFDNIFLCFTHFHWDHIQGFPFFAPAYDKRRQFTISAFGQGRKIDSLKNIFATQMRKEYFPVALESMGASFDFLSTDLEKFMDEGVTFSTLRHNHPGGAYTYKIDDFGKVMVFCSDIEHGSEIDLRVVEFARGADLLIHDAQYTPEELPRFKGWGHSSWDQAIEVAQRAGVKKLVLTHHDPDHDDAQLAAIEKQCQERFPNCTLAREKEDIFV